MLDFERRVVGTLVISTDGAVRASVEDFVDGSLRAMPEHLRAAVVAESLVLGAWASVRAGGRNRPGATAALVRSFDRSRLSPVRQYVRLLRSLVVFAEQELTPVG